MATLKEREKRAIAAALALAQQAGQFPASKLWIDYDDEADVLSISLKRPKQATQTVEVEDQGILLRYRGKELVGITVLDASSAGKREELSPHGSRSRLTLLVLRYHFICRYPRRCQKGRHETRGAGVPASVLTDPALQENVPIPSRVQQGGFSDRKVTSLIQLARFVQVKGEMDGMDHQRSKAGHELVHAPRRTDTMSLSPRRRSTCGSIIW